MYIQKSNFADISTRPPSVRGGFVPLYHADTVNHCPACGHTHWHIGRAIAECAFCETALPLAASASQPMEPLFWSRSSSTAMAA